MISQYTKQKRAESARRRREDMQRHIGQLKAKQQKHEEEEQVILMRILSPLVKITRTEAFREWYLNQRGTQWSEKNEKHAADFLACLGMAGFSCASEIHQDMDGFAFDLENRIREKVAASMAGWAVRMERIRRATPSWFDREKIKRLEEKRAEFNAQFPDLAPWHIDHILPIAGESVCGLHVHTNMRIIPRFLNCTKKNAFDENLLDVQATAV